MRQIVSPTSKFPTGVSRGEGEKTVFLNLYREAVGALRYVALINRPDIAYAIRQVSKYCQNPNQSHLNAVTQISPISSALSIMNSGSEGAKVDASATPPKT